MFSIGFDFFYGLALRFAPLPRAHPFAQLPVFPRYLDVAARPRPLACAFGEESALFVRVGMLLASAGAASSALVLQLLFDGQVLLVTSRAHQLCLSSPIFVVLQHFAGEV